METNWANFADQSQPKPDNSQQNMDHDDDDFGEFGGFEAAEPLAVEAQMATTPLQQGLEASPSPWAVFAGGAPEVGVQPDLIQAQNNIRQNLEPPFPLDERLNTLSQQPTSTSSGSSFDLDRYLITSQVGAQAPVTSNQPANGRIPGMDLAPAPSSLPGNSYTMPLDIAPDRQPNVQLPLDVAQTTNNVNANGSVVTASNDSNLSAMATSSSLAAGDASMALDIGVAGRPEESGNDGAVPQRNSVVESAENVRLKTEVSALELEKQNLQKDFSELLKRNEDMERNLDTLTQQVNEQKEKYEQLQSKHSEDLDEIRKAGHTTLALIVEEYKELCKVALLEQQEACERKLTEAVKKKSDECEQLMQQQNERLQGLLEEEQSKKEKKIDNCIKEEQDKSKAMLEESLKTGQMKSEEMLEKAIENEREASRKSLQEAVQVEREMSCKNIEKEQEKFEKLLEEERQESKRAIEVAMKEEQEKNKEAMKTVIEEERVKTKEEITAAVDKLKVEFEEYLKDKKKTDAALRQRSLTSMDLFLEGARQQLKMLMSDSNSKEDETLSI